MNFSNAARKRRSSRLAQLNANPEFQKKRLAACMKRPTKAEVALQKIIEAAGLDYKYVGNGSRIIGTKNPDFVDEKNHKIIEMFGDYWHSRVINREYSSEDGRREYFRRFGFDTLVIWEHELYDPPSVKSKMAAFSTV